MKRFDSPADLSSRPASELYGMMSSFNELGKMMPDQIENWESTEDFCSFSIRNMAEISLRYQQRIPYNEVQIVSEKAPFQIQLTIKLKELDNKKVQCITTLEANLNPMLSMLASRPLQHLIDTINRKLTA